MRELLLDGAEWHSSDDVYDSFFRAVGAPSWHGRNFDALNDSICTGQINAIEVPYLVVIRNYASIAPEVRAIANDFVDLLREMKAGGCPVEVATQE